MEVAWRRYIAFNVQLCPVPSDEVKLVETGCELRLRPREPPSAEDVELVTQNICRGTYKRVRLLACRAMNVTDQA